MLYFVCHILVFNLNRKFKETAAYFLFLFKTGFISCAYFIAFKRTVLLVLLLSIMHCYSCVVVLAFCFSFLIVFFLL